MPGEVVVAVCKHLDPRSIFNLATAHQHFWAFIDDKQIWVRVQMHGNWCFTNATFLSLIPFAPKVEEVSFKHTGFAQQPHVTSLPQGIVCKMPNLRVLAVQSASFTQGYFVQLLPKLETLLLLECPNFDIDTLVDALQHMKHCKSLHKLDLSGVPGVSSLNKWQVCSLCPNLEDVASNAMMGDFVAEQCLLDCPQLQRFDCWPLACTKLKWGNCAHAF